MSSSPRSALPTDSHPDLLRRFVEASRRAQIVTIVNRAKSEAELGELVTPELCEAFEAEIGFVIARDDEGPSRVVGTYGLRPDETERLTDESDFVFPSDGAPKRIEGSNVLSFGARAAVYASFGGSCVRGVVGVARLYDQPFDEAEAALLEAVAASVEHALDRLRLGEERDRLLREAHDRAQAARVIEAIGDGVLLVDDSGIVQLWNPAAEAITGLDRDAVFGRPVEEAMPGWSAVTQSLVAADERPSSGARASVVPLDLGGREVWLSIRGVTVDDGTVYAFHDLTDERRVEQLKADFIATVSHELRTPLAAVHGAAKTMQRPDVVQGGAVFERLISLIAEQSDRLSRMIDDILLASRVGSPELEIALEHVDVAQLAAEVIAAVRASAREDLTVALSAPRSIPAVAADKDKLRQVVTNLVANAAKYSPAGSRIDVKVAADDGSVRIVVRDRGLGIAPAEQKLIFEKFYRVDANMTRGVSGSGLGLYISRELVRRMGGTISVDSKLGKGSVFTVTLPVARTRTRKPKPRDRGDGNRSAATRGRS